MNQQQNITGPHRWQPGESGNRAGRPVGSRQRIAEALLRDIAEVWEAVGRDVLVRLANDDPATLAKIAYGLIPRELAVSVEQRIPGALTPEQWGTLRSVLDAVEAANANGVPPETVSEWIVEDLRARLARPVLELPCPVALPAAECAHSVLVAND
jgi:hypothetical protein